MDNEDRETSPIICDGPTEIIQTAEHELPRQLDEKDVITFYSEVHAAHDNADDESTHFVLDSDANHHMIKEELLDFIIEEN